jgi:hypothetical protein
VSNSTAGSRDSWTPSSTRLREDFADHLTYAANRAPFFKVADVCTLRLGKPLTNA